MKKFKKILRFFLVDCPSGDGGKLHHAGHEYTPSISSVEVYECDICGFNFV